MNPNGTYKWIAGILAVCLVSFVGWWATQIWSNQGAIQELNTAQDIVDGQASYRLSDLESAMLELEDAVNALTDSVGNMNVTINRMDVKLDFLVDGY